MGSDSLIFWDENVNQIACPFQISISATHVKLKIRGQNIRTRYQFSKIYRDGSAKKHVSDGCSFPCNTTECRSTTASYSNVALLLEKSSSYNGGLVNTTDGS